MAVTLTMPKLTQTMEEGSIVEWLKQEGETVTKGEPIFVVETDKAAIEFEAPAKGVLGRILVQPNETVPVGQAVGVIVAPGEAVPELVAGVAPAAAPPAPAASAKGPTGALAESPTPVSTQPTDATAVQPARPPAAPAPTGAATAATIAREAASVAPTLDGGRIKASPLAKRLAGEMQVDLTRVPGTGPGGRIVRDDVLAASKAQPAAAPAHEAIAPAVPQPVTPGVESELVPVRGIRKAVAEGMALSARSVARVTEFLEADASELNRMRQELLPVVEQQTGVRLSHTHILIKLVARTLLDHPAINAHWTDEGIRRYYVAHVGMAVALPEGLVVPVLKNVQAKSLSQIAVEGNQLAQKARERRLAQDEFTGATFTISNLGTYEIDGFTPIINLPEVGILGVGQIAEKPVVRDGQIVARPMMTLSVAFDHRAIDGAQAAEFLRDLKRIVEQPYRFLL